MKQLNMQRFTNISFFIGIITLLCISCTPNQKTTRTQELYLGFQNPPAEARPFVRWWWNGNKVNADELDRELELLKDVGFGGVEINPIAMPKHAPDNGDKALVWMSDEWIEMLVHACKKTKDLNMIADLIVGTGWPFGGEFLDKDETCQRMLNHSLFYTEGATINVDEQMLISRLYEEQNMRNPKSTHHTLSYLQLVPEQCSGVNENIDLLDQLKQKGKLSYKIDNPGSYRLCYGVLEQNFKKVYLGAPGGAGPVMDHYKKDVTIAYLSRLKKIAEKTGIPLSELLRALFCDSIEISGANWTDDMSQLFFDTYGYSIDQWLPFIFYGHRKGYLEEQHEEHFKSEFKDQLKRVRYDYNNLLVKTFLQNFTQTFQDFCTEENLLCRYQAYGTPFLMGMLDGYMIPDIPESNNWIYSAEMKDDEWQWKQGHGYMTWNMYAAAGGHLAGRKIISCESMTNTKGVFRTTLEEIKQHDDMNFITGINHTILHGFNYSPLNVEFPGWIRYGAFFSERNTWWQHLHHWVDYNARLSYVFQNSKPQKSIAVIGPTADIWGDEGLIRSSFHNKPEYLYKLWEPISQLGYSCEYINQGILEKAKLENGTIAYGEMQYKLLVLASMTSISPEAAKAVKKYVENGGKVIVIDQLPSKSLGYSNYKENDQLVNATLNEAVSKYPKSFIQTAAPKSIQQLREWTNAFLKKSGLDPDVHISEPSSKVYQIHQTTKDKDIYFFTNIHRFESTSFDAEFSVKGKYPYVWNPETGEREPFYYASKTNELTINLAPLQSLLLVFEDEKPDDLHKPIVTTIAYADTLNGVWKMEGKHINGKTLNWEMEKLIDFSQSTDQSQKSFAGVITYTTTMTNADNFTHIDLGDVNEGITELYINGNKIGKRWYGKAIYPIADFLKNGENEIEVRYTTVLANYCKSLNIPQTNVWTKHYKDYAPTGLQGPVQLLRYANSNGE
ncbi:glycosyl hydrolase [Algibacter pacificus]|uniref:glycosyl hydrolase n=1 Tax=Algibacter pacificus TaxID=2599389 RepID=UPI0011C81716|nr:glycosyl hydrolase [Algibacter pacificus]